MIERVKEFPTLTIIRHPLVQHKLTILRDQQTETKRFKELVDEIAMLMAYEATSELSLEPREVNTPLEKTSGWHISGKKLTLVPILLARLGMVEGILRLVPSARVGHIGLYRDHGTLQPVDYYFKVPGDASERDFFLLDPMLATGGSAVAAVASLKRAGANRIRFLCLVAAPEGVRHLTAAHPDVQIYCAALDRQLNSQGYILPGLGDAGDRLFGTRWPLAEPLSRIQPLLVSSVNNPLLILRVCHFTGYLLEPCCRLSDISYPPPQLADQIGQNSPLLPRNAVVGLEGFLEHPRGMTAEVALRFHIPLVDTAPRRTEKKIRNMTRVQSLPLGNLGGGFVLLGATNERWSKRSELLENMLFQHRAHIRHRRKVGLSTGVAAFATHVDEIGEWLGSGGSFVEISPFAAERIRRNYTLGFELVV